MKAERGDEQRINKNWLIFHEKKIVFQTSNHAFIYCIQDYLAPGNFCPSSLADSMLIMPFP